MTLAVEARELGRWYGDVVGVSDVSLRIEGGIVGLLGANGAGKSTFLKLLVGELRPSRGSIRVLGEEPFANAKLYRRIGFAPQQDALWSDLTARGTLEFLLRVSGFSRGDSEARALRALERVKLVDAADRRVGGFSKGMRQRVRIAQAIAHDPEFVVLDEPLNGLDPLARRDTLDLFRDLAEGGTHVLVSSHVLHEVEELTRTIVLLHRGRVLALGSSPEIRALLDRRPRRVAIRARDPRRLARALLDVDGVTAVRLGDDGLLDVETSRLDELQTRFPAIAAAERAGVSSLSVSDASLDALFDDLVGGLR
ncbi:MAG: ABC transporter ATP-binding protein [Planctomycetota bacterium]|nr:ABC transporter ATP-binding protein [Planctomycetota bacterium]